jgi:hypothetical protein
MSIVYPLSTLKPFLCYLIFLRLTFRWEFGRTFLSQMKQNAELLHLFLFEFGYLSATLAFEATSVAFTPVAGRITICLSYRALGYPHPSSVSHLITSFLVL